jgi:hypothetical protein
MNQNIPLSYALVDEFVVSVRGLLAAGGFPFNFGGCPT